MRFKAVCGQAIAVLATAGWQFMPDAASAQDAARLACIEVDTSVARTAVVEQQDSPSLHALRDALDRRLRVGDTSALVLLRLGNLNVRLPVRESWAKTHPNEYLYDEYAEDWVYTGWHYKELQRRFPQSDLADDAAYELTRHELTRGLEDVNERCQHETECDVNTELSDVDDFLRNYPSSPLASVAAERALAAFRHVRPEMDLRHGDRSGTNPEQIRRLVSRLDSLGRAVPAPHRARLLGRAAELWERMGEYRRAKDAYHAAAVSATSPRLGACLSAAESAVPTRWLTSDKPRVIDARRVELNWTAVDGATEYIVRRSSDAQSAGTVVARLPRTSLAWVDTSATSGAIFWYRVIAVVGRDSIPGLPARADIPSAGLSIHRAAVSMADGKLHLFGYLENGFPQVQRISRNGEVERLEGTFYGRSASSIDFRPYLNDIWFAAASGRGVLHFRGNPVRLPQDLRSAVSVGIEQLERYDEGLLFGVDERASKVWVAPPAAPGVRWLAIDCARRMCWIGSEGALQLRDDSGRAVLDVALPRSGEDVAYPRSIQADPADGSAWVLLGDARLLNVDRSGVTRHTVQLPPSEYAWATNLAADFDRRALWFPVTPRATNSTEILRIDLGSDSLPRRTVATLEGYSGRLVPDLSGGVWWVEQHGGGAPPIVRRIDPQGRVTTVALPGGERPGDRKP